MRTNPASRARGLAILGLLVALIALHNDFWLWDDGSSVLGLPIGLLYHVVYCGVVSLVFWGIVASEGRARE